MLCNFPIGKSCSPQMSITSPSPANERRLRGLRARTWLIALAIIAADLLSKALALHFLAEANQRVRLLGGLMTLEVIRNPGAAFGVGHRYTVIIALIAIVTSIGIIRASRRSTSALLSSALGMILGGAVGNLIDRLVRAPGAFEGNVVDWIHIAFLPFVFNLADTAITFGAITLFIAVLNSGNQSRELLS
jgi:signal peptidase II